MKALSTSAVFYGIGHGLMGAQQTSQQLGRLAVECFSGEESVTGSLFGQVVMGGGETPFQAADNWEDMALVEEQGAEGLVCPKQRAELRAWAILLATSSSSRCEEAEVAHGKTLGVLGTGHDSPEVKVKPAFRWETSPEGSKTLALKFLTLP
ncbi:hypothetical protein Q9233_001585 [Columba guinea]|nr:hypothetical protein Q9233_001585 [Columba guinea]